MHTCGPSNHSSNIPAGMPSTDGVKRNSPSPASIIILTTRPFACRHVKPSGGQGLPALPSPTGRAVAPRPPPANVTRGSNANSDDLSRVGSPLPSRSWSVNASAAGTTRSAPSATSDSTAPFASARRSVAPPDLNSMDANVVAAASATAVAIRADLKPGFLMSPWILSRRTDRGQWICVFFMATIKLTFKQRI